MRWFKHFCDGRDESLFAILFDEFSHKGPLVYYRLLEICSRQYEGQEDFEVIFYITELTRYTRVSKKILLKILSKLEEEIHIKFKLNEKKVILQCSMLLERQDEYTRKVRRTSEESRIKKRTEKNKITIPEILMEKNFNESFIGMLLKDFNICSDDLQNSLNAFSFDILNNDIIRLRKITDPKSYFFTVIKKGNIYKKPKNFESSNCEKPVRKQASLKILKDEIKESCNAVFENKFDNWIKTLSDEELKNPEIYSPIMPFKGMIHMGALRSHFRDKYYTG